MFIKIIKTKTFEAITAEKEKMQKALTDIMGKYENLHRLYDGLFERFKNEREARNKTIEELQAQVRKLEHQRNEYKNDLVKIKKQIINEQRRK